jgi:uncharacterized protein (TIGR03437 family)
MKGLVLAVVCLTIAAAGEDVSYTITTAAGGTDCGDGRPALDAELASPEGEAFDHAGNLYIADSRDHRVRRITPEGIMETVAGNGHAGFGGDGGPALEAQLRMPYGVAVDRNGDLYIADLGNARVRRVSEDGTIRTIAGGGSGRSDAGDATGARLSQPRNLAFDSAGNLYISDFGDHRIYKVTPAGLITRLAGLGTPGTIKDGESVAALMAPLKFPAGLAVDGAGRLYVADSGNARVRVIYQGMMSTAPGAGRTLGLPVGVALDPAGRLYVVDKDARAVIRLTSQAGVVIPGGDEGELAAPREAAFDAEGNLYVTDSADGAGFVYRAAGDGTVERIAGSGAYRPPGDGGPALEAHLEGPSGVAVDAAGTLYIADRGNQRVRRVSGDTIERFAGTGAAGYSADGTPADQARLDEPAGVALDGGGNVWIAEAGGHRVRKVNAGGILTTYAGLAGSEPGGYAGDGGRATLARLSAPEGVAVNTAGDVFVADTANHVVRRISRSGTIVTVAGKGVPGYAGDGGAASGALLNTPAGVCLDAQGTLYIADTGNHVVRQVLPDGAIATAAGTGAPLFGGDGGQAALAHLHMPAGVALDGSGNLYIADTGNHRVRKVTPEGVITTIAGDGTPGYSGDGGPGLSAQLNEPVAVAVDAAGNVYAAERANNRVRKLTPPSPPIDPRRLAIHNVVNAASMAAGPVAPGELITIFGSGLGPGVAVEGGGGRTAAGVQVLFNGTPAPLFYVHYSQMNLQAPYGIAGRTDSEVEIRQQGETRVRMLVPVAESAPGLFPVALNEDRSVNSAGNPAPRGTIVILWATGEGETEPAGVDGTPATAPYPRPRLPVGLTIGGQAATLLYAGAAPGYAGLLQINARLPESLAPGSHEVLLAVGGATSPGGLRIVVQ